MTNDPNFLRRVVICQIRSDEPIHLDVVCERDITTDLPINKASIEAVETAASAYLRAYTPTPPPPTIDDPAPCLFIDLKYSELPDDGDMFGFHFEVSVVECIPNPKKMSMDEFLHFHAARARQNFMLRCDVLAKGGIL